jgi:hypothetical protein
MTTVYGMANAPDVDGYVVGLTAIRDKRATCSCVYCL